MYDPRTLEPDTQAILDELIHYHANRLHEFERRLERTRRAKNMDGDHNLIRALDGLREDNVRALAPYEFQVSERIAELVGRPPRPGYLFWPIEQRDLTVASAPGGGYLMAGIGPGGVFVGAMLAASLLNSLGVFRIPLVGQGEIPRTNTTVLTYWLNTEGTPISENNFAFVATSATPKTVGAYCEMSDRWLRQTNQVAQNFIIGEMGKAEGLAVDTALISGSGASGTPLGLLSTSGIGSVSGSSLGWSGIRAMMKAVEDSSGIIDPSRVAWLMAPDVAEILRGREKFTGAGPILDSGQIADYPAKVSKAVPAQTLVFGDWSSIALCEWGILEVGVDVDPYGGAPSTLFKAGLVGLRAMWSCDSMVLRPGSFCKSESIT